MSQQSYNNAAVTLNAISSGAASFVSTKRFFDDVNFPKGFKRCGDFTNKEAELLEQHGHAFKALMEGTQLPGTPDEDQFVQVFQGMLAPTTTLELLWAKYIKLARGKPFYAVVGTIHTYNKSSSAVTEAEIDFDDIDDGEDIDDNDDNSKD